MPPRGENATIRDPPWIKIGTFETQERPKLRREKIFIRKFGEDQEILIEFNGSKSTSIPQEPITTQSNFIEKWNTNPVKQVTIKTNPTVNTEQARQTITEMEKVENLNSITTLRLKMTPSTATSVSCCINTRKKQVHKKGKTFKENALYWKLRKIENPQSLKDTKEEKTKIKEEDETINFQELNTTKIETRSREKTTKTIKERQLKNELTTKKKDKTNNLQKTIANISEFEIRFVKSTIKRRTDKYETHKTSNNRLNFLGKWQKPQAQQMAE